MQCYICGKTTAFGKKIAHDRMYVNGRSNRTFKPNIHSVKTEKGKIKMCTRCMRTLKKYNKPRT